MNNGLHIQSRIAFTNKSLFLFSSFLDFLNKQNDIFKLPKSGNNFTLTPEGSLPSDNFGKYSSKNSVFDAKILGELGTLLPGVW